MTNHARAVYLETMVTSMPLTDLKLGWDLMEVRLLCCLKVGIIEKLTHSDLVTDVVTGYSLSWVFQPGPLHGT